MSSETMSSIFSYRPTTTTVTPVRPSTKKSYIRKYFQTTVTSKVVNFPGNVSDLVNRNEFTEPVVLQQQSQANKKTSNVRFYNKTVAMNVIPMKANQLIIKDEMKFATEGDNDDDEDDGVTISDESSVDESGYEADDEYYDYDDLNKFPQPFASMAAASTTSTTEMPKAHKQHLRDKHQNVQRRMMIEMLRKNPKKPFPDINFPTFINFIKKIQESFAMRTAKTIGEKIKMLMGFRDRMMRAINHQIKRLWTKQPREKVTGAKRRGKRTLSGGGGGGWVESHGSSNSMDFPSAEGALLSICFLTFAVFLIKLVLVSGCVIMFT
jgi:hypothetical protein